MAETKRVGVSAQPHRLQHAFQAIAEYVMNERLLHSIRQVIEHLVAGRYVELETLTNGQRLSAQEMAKAINDYGRKLVLPPEDVFELMDVVEVRNAQPQQWSVAMPLWTREEGRSDLSIGVTVIADEDGYSVELDDIHVL